jgi:hypothetical protein
MEPYKKRTTMCPQVLSYFVPWLAHHINFSIQKLGKSGVLDKGNAMNGEKYQQNKEKKSELETKVGFKV